MADTQTLTYLIKYLADLRGAKVTEAENKKLEDSFKTLGTQASITGRIIGQEYTRTSDGIEKLSIKSIGANGNINTLVTTIGKSGTTIRNTSASTLPLVENVSRLASRALITIPVWLALRSAFVSTTGTINDAADSFIRLDNALKNTQNELQGVANLPGILSSLKDQATGLTIETGVSPDKIVESYRKFVTAGIDAQVALDGMNTAVKGSIATMDDSVETAEFLADIYNSLGDTITEVSGSQDKFNFIMSTIATLMPTNTFTFKEFRDAASNFVATAKQMNLTLDQTFLLIATSATAMQRGARAGTQLSSAFQQLAVKTEAVQKFLGRPTTGQTSFDVYVDVLKKLSVEGQRVSGDIQEIFGLKGLKVTGSEAATFSHFVSEMERLSKLSPNDRMAQLLDRYETSMNKISSQLNRLKEIRETLGRTFLEGLDGGGEFVKTLKSINDELVRMQTEVKGVGFLFSETFSFIDKLNKFSSKIGISGLAEGLVGGLGEGDIVLGKNIFQDRFKTKNPLKAIGQVLSPRNAFRALGLFANQEEAANKPPLPPRTISEIVAERQQTIGDARANDEERRSIAEELLKIQEDTLRSQGLLNSEILKELEASKKKLGISESELDKTIAKLRIEEALTKEKRLQGQLGDESLKLFDISKTSGVDVAKKIGQVLSGEKDLGSFLRSDDPAVAVFKAQFGDLLKQKEAEAFFKGDFISGFQERRGGDNINIAENLTGRSSQNIRVKQLLAINQLESFKRANIAARENEVQKRIQIQQSITVAPNISVTSPDPKEAANEVAKSIKDPRGVVRLALAEVLLGIDGGKNL